MKIFTWKLVYFYLLHWQQLNCDEVRSCEDKVSISCGADKIAISDGTGGIIQRLLEQCNAQHECQVPIRKEKCVNVNFWCALYVPTLVTRKSSIMRIKTEQNAMGLMSEDYPDGVYQPAQDLNCNITFAEQSHSQTEISFMLYDFTSVADSTQLCLGVKDSTTQPFCSGSQYYTTYGPISVKKKRHFSITLVTTGRRPTQTPKVRFWFDIYVSTEDVHLDHLECAYQPGTNLPAEETVTGMAGYTKGNGFYEARSSDIKGITSTGMIVIISTSALGALLVVTVITLVTVFCHRQKDSHLLTKSCSENVQEICTGDETDHTYVDLDSIGFDERLTQETEAAPSHPCTTEKTEAVSLAKTGTTEGNPGQVVLPTEVEMPNDEPVSCDESGIGQHKALESKASVDTNDYLDMNGLFQNEEPMNAGMETPVKRHQLEDNTSIVNEYASTSSNGGPDDGARNTTENPYTRLSGTASKSSGATEKPEDDHKSQQTDDHVRLPENEKKPEESDSSSADGTTSLEDHDYLELIADEEDGVKAEKLVEPKKDQLTENDAIPVEGSDCSASGDPENGNASLTHIK